MSITRYGKRAQELAEWIRKVGRPAVIARDGEKCNCCGSEWDDLTMDHIKNKGSHAKLKRDISNLQLLCYECHRAKTDRKKCWHLTSINEKNNI